MKAEKQQFKREQIIKRLKLTEAEIKIFNGYVAYSNKVAYTKGVYDGKEDGKQELQESLKNLLGIRESIETIF